MTHQYIRAPNLDFVVDGPIRLGQVIENPYAPTKPLYTLNPLPATVTVPHLAYKVKRESDRSLGASFLANLFRGVNIHVGGKTCGDIAYSYSMDGLESTYFQADPTDDEAAALAKQAAISKVLSRWPRRAVYMITGLKIAKGLKYSSMEQSVQSADAGGNLPVVDQVSLGGEASMAHYLGFSESFSAGCDVIIAYRLHTIAKKSWWDAGVEADSYQPKFGFLGDGKKESEEEPVGAKVVSLEDLTRFADLFELDYNEPEEIEVDEDRITVITAHEGDYSLSTPALPG